MRIPKIIINRNANIVKTTFIKLGSQNKITSYVQHTIKQDQKENGSQFIAQIQSKRNKIYQQQQSEDIQFDLSFPNIGTQPQNIKNNDYSLMITKQKDDHPKVQNFVQPVENISINKNASTKITQQKIKTERQTKLNPLKLQSSHHQTAVHKKKQVETIKNEQGQQGFMFKPFAFQDFEEDIQQNDEPKSAQAEKSQQTNSNLNNGKANSPSDEQSLSDSHQSQRQIKGVTITSTSLQGNVFIKIVNKKQLVFSRLPPGIILKCILRKSTDIFNPQYDFYLNNGLKHMLSAKKNSLSTKQIFKLSLQLGKYKGQDLIGAIMANTVHNTYWVYKQNRTQEDLQYEVRATVKYEKLISNQSRKMGVQVHTDSNKLTKIDAKNLGHENNIAADLLLQTIPLKQKQSSIKNFALVDFQDTDYQYLKMNKVSDNMFEVQIQHPLSPFQAFAISLTRFDAQLK